MSIAPVRPGSTGAANYSQMSPLRFLERSAAVFPDRTAIIHGDRTYTYAEFADERSGSRACCAVASSRATRSRT